LELNKILKKDMLSSHHK